MYDSRYDAAVTFDDHRENDVEYVGSTATGNPLFFDTADRTVFEGDHDEDGETIVEVPGTERELEPRESLGEGLESLGDDLDWDSLSEFARERVQTDDGDA
ncbi:hypothetical protein GS429_07905 [Natronorubrum sp. JWXQ-INN-674]|uniref:Uncharacterized protein n=1 Tax=Natronorubrum halalkaliphilum TaxID=2691917 RepID=A0A6B0VMJ9_9EURY|nr:hypothetical protein [Natronorubrum halalkaliphilum]MXV61982.1 hypothetical protein [Natronorubrum halalkaliphilum]